VGCKGTLYPASLASQWTSAESFLVQTRHAG
jgi:hypothetical protein